MKLLFEYINHEESEIHFSLHKHFSENAREKNLLYKLVTVCLQYGMTLEIKDSDATFMFSNFSSVASFLDDKKILFLSAGISEQNWVEFSKHLYQHAQPSNVLSSSAPMLLNVSPPISKFRSYFYKEMPPNPELLTSPLLGLQLQSIPEEEYEETTNENTL